VVLDGLQDPGNAGTIARAAEAFGATGIMFLKGTVSPFNPKALRAAAGSLFRVPFAYGLDSPLARAALQQNKLDVYAGVPANSRLPSKSLGEVDFTRRCAIVIGNEARGVSPQLRSVAMDISIPTSGVDSLNAAMAAGILLYEARRQRSLAA
jgi:TrmH family RNA methyltransferase